MKNKHLLFKQKVILNVFFGLSAVLFSAGKLAAQALTGVKTIPGTYSSIAMAIADLNTNGVGPGGVTFNINAGYTEVLTQKLVLTASGSAANQIVFRKNGTGANPLITAYSGSAAATSSNPDGIWALSGADYVTIDGIDLSDAAANTTNVTTMEYGFGFFKASGTNGCHQNTIKNCTITLNRTNNLAWTFGHNGSIGIVVFNSKYNDATNQVVVTSASGSNSYNKFYSNTIQNCNAGIALNGFAAPQPYTLGDTLNDIGGNGVSTGNMILNFGGAAAATNPATGVFGKDQWGMNVSYNTINNNNGSGINHPNIVRCIFLNASSNGASVKVNYNTLTVKGGGTNQTISAIENDFGGNVSNNNTIEMNNNTITGCSYSTSTAGTMYLLYSNGGTPKNLFIKNNLFTNDSIHGTSGGLGLIVIGSATAPHGGLIEIDSNTFNGIRMMWASGAAPFYGIYSMTGPTNATQRIRNNSFSNITQPNTLTGTYAPVYCTGSIANGYTYIQNNTLNALTANTTGSVYLFYLSSTTPNTFITDNKLVGGFTKTGASGSFYAINNTGTATNARTVIYNNDMSNVSLAGTTTAFGINISTTATNVQTIRKNTFNGFGGASGVITMALLGAVGPNSVVDSNIFNNINGGGAIYGIQTTTNYVTSMTIGYNTLSNITTTGASQIQGINLVNGANATTWVIGNKLYNLSATNAGGVVYAVNSATTTAGNTVNIINNRISGLAAPAATVTSGIPNQVVGINSPMSAGMQNIYNNTILLSATSTGANFGSTALSVNIGATLDLRNNILINQSTPNGTGRTVCFRRGGSNLSSLALTTNNNILYAGDSTIAFRHLYSDGTNVDTLMSAYQARVAARETNSYTENPSFISLTGTDPNYLKITPSIFTNAESKGTKISGVNTDANGTIRSGNAGYNGTGGAPDMGAVEGEYMGSSADQMIYVSSDLSQIETPVAKGSSDNAVLRILVSTQNTYNGLNVSRFKMNTSGTTSAVDISSAKIYYTGTDTVFNTTDLFGSVANPSGTFYINGTKRLASGNNYFWLTYDVKNTAMVGSIIDATGDSIVVDGLNQFYTTPAPSGARTIKGPLAGAYSVGAGQTYEHISDALDDLYLFGVSGPVRFILKDVSYNAATNEKFPLMLKHYEGRSNVNTVTIVPDAGIASTISTSSANPVFLFDNAQYFIIDGSQGGAGGYLTGSSLRIETKHTLSPTVVLRNESSYNTIKYTEIAGRNTTQLSATTFVAAGIISFQTTTGLNGNDFNIIRACAIHADSTVTPSACIGSLGTQNGDDANNDGNIIDSCYIYDYFLSTQNSAGILIGMANSTWQITNNKFFQTTARTWTANGFTHRALWIQTNSLTLSYPGGFIVRNNFIGGSDSSGSGTYWVGNLSGSPLFTAIDMLVGWGTPSSVQGNTITNISTVSSSSSQIASCGISLGSGNVNCGTEIGNMIGSNTIPGAITHTVGLSTGGGGFNAIRANLGGTYNIWNNRINGITVAGGAATTIGEFIGINVLGATYNASVRGNLVGDTAGINGITVTSSATSSTFAQRMIGILMNPSTAPAAFDVTNNIVAGLNNGYASSAGKTRGIVLAVSNPGYYLVKGNQIYNMKTASRSALTGMDAALAGISMEAAQSGFTIDSNIIHSLTLVNAGASANVRATGMLINTGTTGENLFSRNLIHSISKTSAHTAEVIHGIEIGSGNPVVVNNIIRLGIDSAGNSIADPITIRGIVQTGGNAGIYFNSLYIGGSGVGSSGNRTFAYMRTGSGTDDVRNNIFANMRANLNPGGAGHFAVSLANNTTLTENYNILYADSVGVFNNIPQATLNNWRVASVVDANSLNSDPKFINPTGDELSLKLSIDPVQATPIESYGQVISALGSDVDFDGQNRATLTPVDLGADAGNYTAADFAAPVITYTPPTNTLSTGNRVITATIADYTGVYQTAGLAPAIYYKKSASGTLYSATGVKTSGSAQNGTWDFIINSTTLGGLAADDSVYYFIVAQDSSSTQNLGSNPGGVEGGNVGTILVYPPFNAYKILAVLNGVLNVGVGQNLTTLTGPNGAFNYIKTSIVGGDITLNITSDIEEPGTVALSNWTETGTGNYRVRIVPANNTVMNITSTYRVSPANTDAFIRIDGADRVTIDGRYNGTGRYLRFMNRDSLGATLNLLNDADGDSIVNCIFEGINKTVGTLNLFGTNIVGGTGNDSNVIMGCLFRDTLGSAITHPFIQNKPNTGVFSQGVTTGPNDYNQVLNCEFDNIRYNALNISTTGGGDYWTFYGNSVYTTNDSSFVNLVYLNIAGGGGHIIRKNSIGGSAPDRSGTCMKWHYPSTIRPVYYFTGSAIPSVFDSNTIANIAMFNPGSAVFQPSFTATNGSILIKANVIGGAQNPWDTISIQNTAYPFYITMPAEVANNVIGNIYKRNSSASGALFGIYCAQGSGILVNIHDNEIRDLLHSYTTPATGAQGPIGIYMLASNASMRVERNTIYNIGGINGGAMARGIHQLSGGTGSYIINANRIYNIYSTSTGAGAYAAGLAITGSAFTVFTNNQISLGANTGRLVFGLMSGSNPGSCVFHNNSVFINGKGDTTSFGVGIQSLGTVDMRNNIIYNKRVSTGGYKNLAVGAMFQPLASVVGNIQHNLFITGDTSEIALDSARLIVRGWTTLDTLYKATYNKNWAADTLDIPADSLFTDTLIANLDIVTANTHSWYANGKGMPMAAVTGDYGNQSTIRSTAINTGSTDIGADEFTPLTAPPAAYADKAPFYGDSTQFFFGSRVIAKLNWDMTGTLPTSVDAYYHSGVNAPALIAGRTKTNAYWNIQAIGGSGYAAKVTLMQDSAILGDVVNPANLDIVRYTTKWTQDLNTTVNISKGTFTSGSFVSDNPGIFTGTDGSNNPLPVKLTVFTAVAQHGDVVVNWTTASEINNYGFEVERSVDGRTFTFAGFVKGAGNSIHPLSYSLTDGAAFAKATSRVLYYRLKQVDMNGVPAYSQVVCVVIEESGVMVVYPNPFNNEMHISFHSANEGTVAVRILNIQGMEVLIKDQEVTAGMNAINIDGLMQLSKGLYFVELKINGETTTVKMLKD